MVRGDAEFATLSRALVSYLGSNGLSRGVWIGLCKILPGSHSTLCFTAFGTWGRLGENRTNHTALLISKADHRNYFMASKSYFMGVAPLLLSAVAESLYWDSGTSRS